MKLTREERRKTQRPRRAWYMYDFGNSAYAAVVLLAVYATYFQKVVVEGNPGNEGTRLWGISLSLAMIVVALLSPILGTIADYAASKKRFLLLFSAITWIFTALLFFVQKGDIFIGMLFFILAEIGYRGGQVFYNALLSDVVISSDEMGRVSGNGWAIGSLGGIACLLFILPVIVLTKSDPLVVRGSMAFTALFFSLSTLPLFLWVKERREPRPLPEGETYVSLAIKRLRETFMAVRHFKEFIKFILSFLIYNDGVLMALNFASIIGAALFNMDTTQLIIFMIIVQVTSALGAYLFGLMSEHMSFKRALLISLVLMIISVVWMIFNQTLSGYFVVGALAGFALTGVQSLSRTMTGLFAPQQKSAEFFSFFAIAGKSSSFIGPLMFGTIAFRLSKQLIETGVDPVAAGQAGYRAGLGLIVVFLVVGMIVLLFVNEKRARQAALEPTGTE